MKNIFLAIILLVTFVISRAQTKSGAFSIQLTPAVVVPLGSYADKTYTNNLSEESTSGLAKTGWSANASVYYNFSKSSGILFSLGYFSNTEDAQAYKKYYEQASPGSRVETQARSWKIVKPMAGVFHTVSLTANGNWNWTSRIMAGVCKTAAPGYSTVTYNSSGMQTSTFKQDDISLPAAFCYELGTGLFHSLSKQIQGGIGVDYFQGSSHKSYTYNPNFPNPGSFTTVNRKFQIQTLDIGASMRFSFN